MPLIERYHPPADLRDITDEDSPFYDEWHAFVDGNVSSGPTGGSLEPPADPLAGPWFDPLKADLEPEDVRVRILSWIGFPRATLAVDDRDDRARAFAEAEEPGDVSSSRARQFEYFEWFTTRDRETRKITKVAFSTETPEYWELLAAADPDRVVELYRGHVDPGVKWEDLVGADGRYDRRNRWTTTDGMMHYVNGINELQQALGLAKGGAESVGNPPDPQLWTNDFDRAGFGANAADDYILREVAALGRAGFTVTAQAPVGLYIDGWDDSGWTKPDGSPVGDYWTITRGSPGTVLRLEYEVPEEEGFAVGDIRIGGRPIEHGGQLAEHMTSSLPVVFVRRSS